jgi:hypothetical protein
VEKLKLSHKDTVDRLQLELSQAKGEGSNVPQAREQSSLIEEETKEPGTPFVSGSFNSPAMASPEARSDQVRGAAQDRGVGSGMMLSPQRESSGQRRI